MFMHCAYVVRSYDRRISLFVCPSVRDTLFYLNYMLKYALILN